MNTDQQNKLRRLIQPGVFVTLGFVVLVAAMFGPQLTSAAGNRRETILADQLRYIRTQIMVYRAHHNGVAPGYPRGDVTAQPTAEVFVEQMTRYTNADGNTSDRHSRDFRFGPYLTEVPANSISGSRYIEIIADETPFPSASRGTGDWLYKPATCTFAADLDGHDTSGMSLFAY